MCTVLDTACYSCNAGHHLRYVEWQCCPTGCRTIDYGCGSC